MNLTRKRTCGNCKEQVPIEEIQYITKANGSIMELCEKCRNRKNLIKRGMREMEQEVNKVSFLCNRCKFKFKFDFDSPTKFRCPYCGEVDDITEMRGR